MRIGARPDDQRARALREMARLTLERLERTEKQQYPSNTITDYYDALHKLMDAIAFERGTRIKGDGAHKELIDHLHDTGVFTTQERIFLQELREYRNRIAYEGFSITREYLERAEPAIKRILKKLTAKR